jgi:hypothetical protein
MTKTLPIAAISLAAVSVAAMAALVGERTDANTSKSSQPSSYSSGSDWTRRGTRDGSEFTPGSSAGPSAELPRRGMRSDYETIASAVETPDTWSRRGAR